MLHPVPAPAEEQQPKRSYENIVRAIYNDTRAGHEARELLLAVAYAVKLAPREEGVSPLREARRVLGRDSIGRPRCDELIKADRPRYQPPRHVNEHTFEQACVAPRLRPYKRRPAKPSETDPTAPTPIRPPELPPEFAALKEWAQRNYTPPRDWRTEDGICGADARHQVLEKDPRTGWVVAHYFCKRHTDHAQRVTEQLRAQNEAAPEPIPNTGGLLPCYFKADWEAVYRHYAPHWKTPIYGLCADDWPTPGAALPSRRMLRMVASGTGLGEEAE